MSLRPLLLVCLFVAAAAPAMAFAQQPAAEPPDGASVIPAAQLESALASMDDPNALLQLAGQLRDAGERAKETLVWKRLVAIRPHMGVYRYELAAAYAQQDLKSETYNTLLELQASGFGHRVEDDPRFKNVTDTQVWGYIVEGFTRNRDSFGEGRVVHTLPRQDLLIESLVFDPTRGRLLAGSVREGKVFSVEEDGSLKTLVEANAENGLWGVFGVAVDAERGVLWVASTAVPHFRAYSAERDLGKAGIFKFELASGKFIKSFLSPVVPGQSFFMSNIAAAGDGSVYALDGVNSAIYQVRDDSFRRLLHAPHLSGLRGITVSADSKRVYFSDLERGIFGLDLDTAKPFDVAVPKNLSLASIEALSFWNGYLLAVQNGLPPNRVMRLKLSDSGKQIIEAHPLLASQQALPLQVGVTVAPDASVYLIGNSQRDNYDRFGLPRNKERLEGARIYRFKADYELQREAPAAPTFVR
jgi:hypothetical protein